MNIIDSMHRNKMSPYQIGVIGMCIAINMLDGFDVLVMAFTASSVANEWNLTPTAVGILLSAGLFGMAAGSLFIAPLADIFGRRTHIMLCLIVISLGMALSACTQSATQLAIFRVITGWGIGGALASLTVFVSEYSSDKWRNFNLSVLQTGYPIGAVIGGSIAAILIGVYGWRGVFLFGAMVSTSMLIMVFFSLPESIDFLMAKRPANWFLTLNKILRKMRYPLLDTEPATQSVEIRGIAIKELFTLERRKSTILVWLSYFMVMFSFYFVLSWTPKLMVAEGMSKELGISAGVLINLGGIAGGLVLGLLATRFALSKVISVFMLAAGICMIIFGEVNFNLHNKLVLGVIIGVFLFGSMIGLYALAPQLYPANVRTTGMGWAIGIGRIGAILSPIFAGLLLNLGWQGSEFYSLFSIPLIVSTALVLMVGLRSVNRDC